MGLSRHDRRPQPPLIPGRPRPLDRLTRIGHACDVRGFLCPSLIGRDVELDELFGAIRGAKDSRGSFVFLVGEAGIGKSRLARESIEEARRQDFAVLLGRAAPAQGAVAFRPISEALFSYFRGSPLPDVPELASFRPVLGRLVPEWRVGAGRGVDESIVMLAEAVLRLLGVVGRRAGCLLVLEDLHWADPETVSIVEYLAENLASEPVVVLCTVRSEQANAALGLAHALEARRGVPVLTLARLDPAETAAMGRACMSDRDLPEPVDELLASSADGLPFFVEELLAGAVSAGALVRGEGGWTVRGPLHPQVPRTFVDSVDHRLANMTDELPVLHAAAVLGRRFEWTLLCDITGRSQEQVLAALRAGVDAQLLVAEPSASGAFRFRHALTRDAVVGRLLPVESARLARRALDAISGTYPDLPGEWCSMSARLAELAGDRSLAAVLLIESGRRSLAGGALASAEDTFARADELADDPVLHADAAEALCETLCIAGKVDRALEVGSGLAIALQSLAAPPQRIARLHVRLARACVAATRWDAADRELRLARECAAQAGEPLLTARAEIIVAQAAVVRGDLSRASEVAQAVLAEAERSELPDLVCEALEVIGRCARVDDQEKAELAFSRAASVAERSDLAAWRLSALFELGTMELISGAPATRLKAASELASSTGALAVGAQVDMHLAAWHLDHFEPDAAAVASRRSSEIARRVGMHVLLGMALMCHAASHGMQGRRDEMEALIEEALAVAGDEPSVVGCVWAVARAEYSMIRDDRDQAILDLDTAMGYLRRSPVSPPVPGRGLWALLRVVSDRDGEAARAEVQASGAVAKDMNRAFLRHAEAVMLGRAGRRTQAEAEFAAADAGLATVPRYRHYARRLVAEAAIADQWGDPVAWLQPSLAQFEEYGHDRLAAACRSLLYKAGGAVPRRGRESHIPLALRELGVTQREVEVLALLGEGLGNREIASRLYLSPRTVERHIANVSDKTGLRTRSEVIAFAARSGAKHP